MCDAASVGKPVTASIKALVRIHNAQEEDICEHAVGA
jgi:hypothetical protein